jgi:mycothiol synthase
LSRFRQSRYPHCYRYDYPDWVINSATAQRLDRLTAAEVDAVLELARAAGDTDGALPLSEHVVLHLRHGGDFPSVHLVVRSDNTLVGYAHVDVTDVVEGPSAELVVHPLHRRRGLGRALVLAAVEAAQVADPAGRLRLWAHGDHPSASALALSLGFTRSRVLWQMRRSLFAELPEVVLPPGVHLRPFRPGEDDRAWVDLNKKAFAHHPEQGKWELRDLRLRMNEPWFDPDGFLLAQRDNDPGSASGAEQGGAEQGGAEPAVAEQAGAEQAGAEQGGAERAQPAKPQPAKPQPKLLGFHWTKVHGEVRRAGEKLGHHHDPIGEVYVLGLDPQAQGLGLGRALTVAGLRYLRARGLDQVMLYVDESNVAATALYTRLGFARWSTDVLFRRGSLEG